MILDTHDVKLYCSRECMRFGGGNDPSCWSLAWSSWYRKHVSAWITIFSISHPHQIGGVGCVIDTNIYGKGSKGTHSKENYSNAIASADCKITVVSLPGLEKGCNFSFASRVQWISIVLFALCDTREYFVSILDNEDWQGCEVAVLLLVLKYMSKREFKRIYIVKCAHGL